MPYVLRHESTGEIAAAILRNSYDIAYFGVQWWASSEAAALERDAFLAAWQYEGRTQWQVIAIDDDKLKMLNVKLKNNPAYMVCLDAAGMSTAKLREDG